MGAILAITLLVFAAGLLLKVLYRYAAALVRIILAVCLAVGIGFLIDASLTTDRFPDGRIGAFISLVLVPPSVWVVILLADRRKRASRMASSAIAIDRDKPLTPTSFVQAVPNAVSTDSRRWFLGRRKIVTSGPDRSELAWTALLQVAGGAASRIAVARRSCDYLLAAADSGKILNDPNELVIVVRKHVPAAIESSLSDAKVATAEVRRELIEALVEALEHTAAEAERLLARQSGAGNWDVAVLRNRLRNMAGRGSI